MKLKHIYVYKCRKCGAEFKEPKVYCVKLLNKITSTMTMYYYLGCPVCGSKNIKLFKKNLETGELTNWSNLGDIDEY